MIADIEATVLFVSWVDLKLVLANISGYLKQNMQLRISKPEGTVCHSWF